MNYSSPLAVIWDENHIKALLNMHGHPLRRIQAEPWQTWVKQRGGLHAIRHALRSSPLVPKQRDLLSLILDYPDASSIFYASKLNVSQSNYFLHLNSLIKILLEALNNWKIEPPLALLNNLPVPLTSLVGAEENVTAVTAILRRSGVRLLTLTGPGGVGKTRLAIAVGTQMLENFRDGIFFIHLESLNDPAFILTQIAHSLAIENVGSQSLLDTLKTYLRKRQLLLILDNFEQLVEGGATITDLLEAAGSLKVLITSREALNLYGENRFIVPELPLPDPKNAPSLQQLKQSPAVDLFIQRVQARHPTFSLSEANKESVLSICSRLDGLPLAIELAAAQVKQLSHDQVLPLSEHNLKSLRDAAHDRPARQKTLWAAIHWSYQLLSDGEKALFRRLAVFGRTWSLDAAESVCQIPDALTSLEQLTDKSLLRYAPQGVDGDLRFQMLQAVREYALDQLASHTETEEMQRCHARYYLALIERAELTFGSSEQLGQMRRIEQELENLQIALQWMLDKEETEMAFTLLGAAWRFYHLLNIWSETRLWMERALAQGKHLKSAARAKTLWGASWLAANQGDYAGENLLAVEGLALAREIDHRRLTGLLLQNVADGFFRRKEYTQSTSLLEESLHIFRELDDKEEFAFVLARMASIFWLDGRKAQSKEMLQESLSIFRGMGHAWAIATILRQLGQMALEDEDNHLAATLLEESLTISRTMGTKQRISEILRELALLRWRQGDFEQVQAALDESLSISHQIGDQTGLAWTINLQGRLALEQSHLAIARALFEKAQVIFQKIGEETAIRYNHEYLEQVALAENKK